MQKLLIASVVLIAGAFILADLQPAHLQPAHTNPHQQYRKYLVDFGKEVESEVEFTYRAQIFERFVLEMEKHNADPSKTWKMGINQFSDLTKE